MIPRSSLDDLFDCEQSRISAHERRIKDLIDSGDYPPSLSMPLSVQLELTDKCNLECKHCYNRSGEKHGGRFLRAVEWLGIAQDIVNNGGVFQVVVSGGEPLLLKNNLYRIMDIFHADSSRFVFITNGYLLDKERVNILKRYNYAWLQVSIDGVDADTHDNFRQKKGSWERALAAAILVSNEGIPMKVASSLQQSEIYRIDEYVEQAYQLGASAIILGDIMPSGRALDFEGLSLSIDQKNELIDNICDVRERYRGKIEVQTSSFMKLQLQQATVGPIDSVIIRPNGDVRLDCIAPFVVGNVMQESFSSIWKRLPGDIWRTDKVTQYIDSVDNYTGISSLISNHNDLDVVL